MFGVCSSNLRSWRRAIRSLIFLLLAGLAYRILDYGYSVTDVRVIFIVSMASIFILFIPGVRRFYTPPLVEMPPLKRWILYVFFRPKDSFRKYEFVYD